MVVLFFYNITLTFSQCFTTGADLSYVNAVESNGGIYQDANGDTVDPFELFAAEGAKMIRLRLWHTPENLTDFCGNSISNSNLNDLLIAAERIKSNGMQFKLSIHYSDYFVDPSKQQMPKIWMGLDQSTLLDSIGEYTNDVLNKLYAQNTVPDIVSVGNETTWGFIDETSTTNGWDWPNDAEKYNFVFTIIVATLIGGASTIVGPMFGAFFLTFLLEYLRPFLPGAERYLIYGAIALLLYMYQPKGLYHIFMSQLDRFKKKGDDD